MSYSWVFLSLFSAFGQALGWALRKKTLQIKRAGNALGMVSFSMSVILLTLIWGIMDDWTIPEISERFVTFSLLGAAGNILAFWTGHKAMERANLSLLTPFLTLSSLIIIPFEYYISDLVPNSTQVVGIIVVVAGAFLIAAKGLPDRNAYKAMKYYAITILCFSFMPITLRVCVLETNSPWFSGLMVNILVMFGFVALTTLEKDWGHVLQMAQSAKRWHIFAGMVSVGCVMVLIGCLPMAIAFMDASAAEVIALKRTMPFFALLFGIFMFKEQVTLRHALGTALLVVGCMLVVYFK